MDPFMHYVSVMQRERPLLTASQPVGNEPIIAGPGLRLHESDRSLCNDVAAKAG